MSLRRAFFLAASLVVVAAAASSSCASFSEGADANPNVRDAGEGGDGAIDPLDATPAVDSGLEGGDAGSCRAVIDDSFDKVGTWEVYGTPGPSVANGEVMLIDEQPSQGSALRWPTPISAARFVVQATFRVGQKPPDAGSVGDGIGFAWMPTGRTFMTTSTGQDMFICDGPNVGNVVMVGSSNRRLRIGTLDADSCGTGGALFPSLDTSSHILTFEVTGKSVRAVLDGDLEGATGSHVDAILANGYPSFYFIIGSSSGGAHAAHYLQRIVVTACE